jgi:glutamate/tyrosine decarboxylase-like PLP-dependent enzyme
VREPKDWNPEWSRRGRGFAVYAGISALGRQGIAAIVERCCAFTARLVDGLAEIPGIDVLVPPQINQALVRFLAADGDHDRHTDRVIARIQASGAAWFGGTTWRGMRAMRISVCNWRTGDADLAPVLALVRACLADASCG